MVLGGGLQYDVADVARCVECCSWEGSGDGARSLLVVVWTAGAYSIANLFMELALCSCGYNECMHRWC